MTFLDSEIPALIPGGVGGISELATGLRARAGTGTVAGNLTGALTGLFASPILALIRLIIARDELRARLRAATGSRFPLVSESTAMIAGYLDAERDRGRVFADADIGTLAPTLIGAVHLMFADTDGPVPDADALGRTVAAVLATATS
jgi:hypothetical protein